jgi:hypothetical protein
MLLLRLAQALDAHKVSYAIAGGYAVALHGAFRGTFDIDLVIQLRKQDFVAIEAALLSLGLTPRQPISSADLAAHRKEYISKRNLIAWTFINKNNPIELVDVLIAEDLSKLKSTTKMVQGVPVKVLAKADLIAMKKKSGRPQDLEDVKALKTL